MAAAPQFLNPMLADGMTSRWCALCDTDLWPKTAMYQHVSLYNSMSALANLLIISHRSLESAIYNNYMYIYVTHTQFWYNASAGTRAAHY